MTRLFYSKAVAAGRCPTPYFLFGTQKGSEKSIARLRRFFQQQISEF